MARYEMNSVDMAGMGQGPVNAQNLYQMGLKYAVGRDVESDLVTAHKWFNLAALKGSKEAADYRKEISSEMTADQIAQAQREAREWLSLH
ncbi:MAG: hypothetical protein ABJN26_06265 [Stappiaceae bacterium]